jgi:hypothetical protein
VFILGEIGWSGEFLDRLSIANCHHPNARSGFTTAGFIVSWNAETVGSHPSGAVAMKTPGCGAPVAG